VDGVAVEIQCVLKASYPVEVKITGPIRGDGHQLMTVPKGKDQKARATNPGSTFNLRGGDTSVPMHAPYPPGDYELLYVTPGLQSILLSVPFRVVAPKAKIFALDTVESGTTIEVRVEGEISPHTKINIVPVDSPSTLVGDHAYLSPDVNRDRTYQPSQPCYGCSTFTARVPLRKAKSGKYEIQYVTNTSHVVYARRPLTIK
jgi:hypothetical protein